MTDDRDRSFRIPRPLFINYFLKYFYVRPIIRMKLLENEKKGKRVKGCFFNRIGLFFCSEKDEFISLNQEVP